MDRQKKRVRQIENGREGKERVDKGWKEGRVMFEGEGGNGRNMEMIDQTDRNGS